MSNNIQFPQGIRVFGKNANAPEFVGDTIKINTPELIEWLTKQPATVRLQITTSKEGNKYLRVDNWEPKQQPSKEYKQPEIKPSQTSDGDLPF